MSFTKGCYTGQELVARIDSRGSNVPRHLRGLLLAARRRPAPCTARRGGQAKDGREPAASPAWLFRPSVGWVGLGYAGPGGRRSGETLVVAWPPGPGAV